MNTLKHAKPDHAIHPLIASRWSPYAFSGQAVETDKLLQCLEAARWAASSYNEQPWRFIVATRDDTQAFATMLGCLMEANQGWAENAGVLIVTAAKKAFAKNDKPNRVAEHDVALAVANLTFQASELGLHVHQMAGLDLQKARHTYHMPDGFDPVTAIAIGYAAPVSADTSDPLGQRDVSPRQRMPLSQWVFTGEWDKPAPFLG